MSDKLTETTAPESQLPRLQKEEMVRGKDDLEFCIEAINKDYPVQYADCVGFYDRLLENGLKITAIHKALISFGLSPRPPALSVPTVTKDNCLTKS